MKENLTYSEGNDSVICTCLLFYTIIIAVISFWIGTIFSSQSASPDNSSLRRNSIIQIRTQLTFVSMSEYVRRRIQSNEFKIQNEEISSIISEPHLNSSVRTELQRDILIDSILDCYVFPWYNRISGELTFPYKLKQILQTIFNRFYEKIQKVDRTSLAKEIIQIVHYHWKEYCSALDKGTDKPIAKNFKFIHECVTNPNELSKHYDALINRLLKDLLAVEELNCNIFRQFLSGILVKCFIMYYTSIACEPRWLNKILIALISTGSFPETPDTRNSYEGERISQTQPSSPNPTIAIVPTEIFSCIDSPKENKLNLSDREIKNEFTKNESQMSSASEIGSSNSSLNSTKSLDIKSPFSMIASTSKEQFASYFNMESLPGIKEVRKTGCTPGLNTISVALGEIFSSAALPLLPEGYAYRLTEEIESACEKQKISSSIEENVEQNVIKELTSSTNSCKEVRFSYNELLEEESGIDKEETKPIDLTSPFLGKSRHFSLNDEKKSKCGNVCMEKPAKSLDETKASQTIARKNEYEWTDQNDSAALTKDEKESERLSKEKESEDFATTIAKLRSLLEQRESQNNLMEFIDDDGDGKRPNSPKLATELNQVETSNYKYSKTPVCKIKSSPYMSTTNLGSDTADTWSGSLEVEKLNKIVDELEESETEVNCFFLNVVITKTELCGDMSSQSTLYCIQYEGVYLECENDSESQKFVLRTTTVKRGFKDFLALQTQLEGNPIWKPHLKGMKTPKKWLHISFTNQNAVSQRRAHLEHYLQQLCYHPVLGFCKELRQFMAYGEDGYEAFGMKSDLVTYRKFDKLAKTFSEVFNTLREAVPHFESEFPVVTLSDFSSKSPTAVRRKKIIPSFLNFDKHSSDRNKTIDVPNPSNEEKLVKIVEIEHLEHKNETVTSDFQPAISEFENEKSPGIQSNTSLSSEFPSECYDEVDRVDSIYPLASSMTQFLCDVLWLPQHKPHSASVSAFMAISGKSLENYLQESMDLFLCEEAFTGYLDLLTSSLSEWSEPPEISLKVDYEPEFSKSDLKNTFKQRIPVWIRWMWGRNRSEETIDRLVGFLQDPDINHDLILSIAEQIFLKLTD